MRNFRKLEVWVEARKLVLEVYKLALKLPSNEKFGLYSQITRCVISIPANIAEGSAKESTKDFIRFLEISLGSSYELETHLLLCKDLKYLGNEEVDLLIQKLQVLQKRIFTLITFNKKTLRL